MNEISLQPTEDLGGLGIDEGLLLADGLEEAFIGVVFRFGLTDPIACYDYHKCLEILKEDGMSEMEAEEYFHYNTLGAWVGDRTPCFVAGTMLDAIKKHYEENQV